MSFDLGFLHSIYPLTVAEVGRRYVALCERDLDGPTDPEGISEPHENVAAFAAEMMSLFPSMNELSDDDDSSPWSGDPDIAQGYVIVTLRWSRCEVTVPVLREMAMRHRLTVYDPQDNQIYLPPKYP